MKKEKIIGPENFCSNDKKTIKASSSNNMHIYPKFLGSNCKNH
jgi:hypothetical protein